MKSIRFLQIIFISLLIMSCKDNPLDSHDTELPPIEESIPYDILGGGKVLFERIGPGGYYEGFYVIDVDEQKSWGIPIGSTNDPCISPDGTQIAYTNYTGDETWYDVYIMDVYGDNRTKISNLPSQDRCPTWDKNDDLLVFWVEGIPDLIYTTKVNGSEMTLIRTLYNNSGLTSFTPSGRMSISNGNKIVYAVNNGRNIDGLTSGLCIMNLDGSDLEVLLYSPIGKFIESPRFSPEGMSLAYLTVTLTENRGEFLTMNICIVDILSDSVKVIYSSVIQGEPWADPSILNSVWVCWSPNGEKLLFSKPVADFTSYLYSINKDGSGLTQVTSLEGVTDRHISWSN